MHMAHANTARTSAVAIFGRLLSKGQGALSPELAAYVLTLGFGKEDQARMQDLAARNQEGALTAEERDELFAFVRAGHLLALLHSKARMALNKAPEA
jgi:hypothetical protein